MADVYNIQKLVKAAAAKELAKQASSVDSARNREHEEDIKSVPANVDSHTAAGAVGGLAKAPEMNIGTKAEATSDEKIDGISNRENNDAQAFKQASDLQKLAGSIVAGIEAAVSKQADTAITSDAAEGTSGKDSTDDPGKQENIEGGEANGEAAQTTTSGVQTAPVTPEVAGNSNPEVDPAKSAGALAADVYQMAQQFLVAPEEFTKQAGVEEELAEADVEGLEDSEADELAAALEASARDAAVEGAEDADNVAQYLSSYQDAEEQGGLEGLEGLGAEDPMPEVGAAPEGQDGDVEALLQMLQEAGVSPEELEGLATQKQASTQEDAWAGLSKEAKHDVILKVMASV